MVNNDISQWRSLSQIFSPANFHQVVREESIKATEKKINKYFPVQLKNKNYGKVLSLLYAKLKEEYCSEYFFKNSLFNQEFLKRYSINTTTVFNEFKIGTSIADFVLLNGKARIYEIKTDFDGLEKLEKQLHDYKQFADEVYIVTSAKYISRLMANYKDTTIGIIEFTPKYTFKEHKKAALNHASFNHSVIFKTLRKAEYLEIVKDYFGYIPDVPNTKIFRECLGLLSTIDVVDFQRKAFNKLKKRKIKCPELLLSDSTPYELKQICYTLDFNEEEYSALYKFLNKPV